MSDDTVPVSGGCYCGKVRYRARLDSAKVTECHCSQCRKQSGHRYATTHAKAGNVEIEDTGNITWFRASSEAERGFCTTCGSHLFWKSLKDNEMAILAASIDDPVGLHMARHIYVEDKAPYYEITDGLPQFNGYDTPVSPE